MAVNPNIGMRPITAGGDVVRLVAVPLAVLAALAIWAYADMALSVGPTGRLAIALVAIGVVALVARPILRRPAAAIATGAALAAGGLVVLGLSLAVNQVGCQPAGALDVAFHLAPAGAATTLATFAGLAAAAVVGRRRGVLLAALTAAGVGSAGMALAFLTLVASFPGLGCAYVPA